MFRFGPYDDEEIIKTPIKSKPFKKVLIKILLILILVLSIALYFYIPRIKYTLSSTKDYYYVESYFGPISNVEIKSVHKSKPVLAIAAKAFKNCSTLKTIKFLMVF